MPLVNGIWISDADYKSNVSDEYLYNQDIINYNRENGTNIPTTNYFPEIPTSTVNTPYWDNDGSLVNAPILDKQKNEYGLVFTPQPYPLEPIPFVQETNPIINATPIGTFDTIGNAFSGISDWFANLFKSDKDVATDIEPIASMFGNSGNSSILGGISLSTFVLILLLSKRS